MNTETRKIHNILITGGAGFIGYHMAKNILDATDAKLTLVDNLNDYYIPQLKLDRLKELGIHQTKRNNRVEFKELNLTEKNNLKKIFDKQYDVVIHLAAQAGVRYAAKNPRSYIESNIDGFFNILDSAAKSNTKLFMYASSSSVYGANTKIPFQETDLCDSPLSLYAATKLSNELMTRVYTNNMGLCCIGMCFFNVYGAWGRPDAVYYKWADALRANTEIELRDSGNMYRDMTHVDDVVRAVFKLMQKYLTTKEPTNEIFNIGNSSPVRIGDVLDFLIRSKLHKKEPKIIFKPRGTEEPTRTYASTEKLKTAINYAPSTSFKRGLGEFLSWYKSYYEIDNKAA